MSATQAETRMTAEEFFALPDDGTDRQLIAGRLLEKPMTYRNRTHAWVEARITFLLGHWLATQQPLAGELFSGEVGCVLSHERDTIVGIDVAYFARETVRGSSASLTLIAGPPLLAVEILSPSDRQEEIHAKVRAYLEAGTRLVWIVDPYFRTVQVHSPGTPPAMCNDRQTLQGGDVLPGLELPVGELFPV
ncbi:MAG: Uma2 family endonuclease [Pirellulaceae bacterium]|nr:Uma2 family endonuclease [Pirellulaceae bacterium]